MKLSRMRYHLVAAAVLCTCASTHAAYQSPSGDFTLSGFGTLGAVRNSTDDAKVNYPSEGGGATTTPSLNPDSKLAIQGTYRFNPEWSITSQVMTRYDANGQFVPDMEWAFAKWQALPSVSVRAGRIGAPFFMISDFRNVGYALTTVRPPLDIYNQVPVSQFEGADVTHQFNTGPLTLTSTLWFGNSQSDYAVVQPDPANPLTAPTNVELKKIWGLNIQAELDNGLSMRAGWMTSKMTLGSNGSSYLIQSMNDLVAAATAGHAGNIKYSAYAPLYGYIPLFQQTAALLTVKDVDASFAGVGATYDSGDYVVSLEYTKRKTKSFVADTTGWAGTFGYRIDAFTPYVGVSRQSVNRQDSNPLSPLLNISEDLNQLIGGMESFLNTQKRTERTLTVGTRWDIHSGLSLKGQLDHVKKPADSQGTFFNAKPNFISEARTLNVLSVSLDFVF